MKIFNVTKKKIKLLLIILLCLFLFLILIKIINKNTSNEIIMNAENYSQILKKCHDSPYDYLGKKITTEGYVFRANDFNVNQFVTARDMLVSNNKSIIVGFLCESDKIAEFENNEWIIIKGTLEIGDYHGLMPIIKVNSIERITTPNDVFVLPPN